MHFVTDRIDYSRYLKERDGQAIYPASTWKQEVVDRISGNNTTFGDLLPWSKTHSKIQLRPGEVTLWAGINGHGKSLVVGQAMLWLLPSRRVLIASMEMLPAATLERMTRQASGSHHPAEQYVDRFLTWTDNRLWIYDQQDSVAADKILGMVAYAGDELKIEHIVIDSLMKCGMAPDDYAAQKRFVDRLCWLAKDTGAHIHLVAHVRKSGKESDLPDKFDIKGASEITDLVDNVIITHRNKLKETEKDAGGAVPAEVPDTLLSITKQRHGEWEGRISLWFDLQSNQFLGDAAVSTLSWPSPGAQHTVFNDQSPQ